MIAHRRFIIKEQYLHRMTWHGSCTTIIWAKSYDQRDLLLCLGFDLTFVCDQRTIYAWGHKDSFASSMGHPRSYSVELLMEDGMRQYLGH